MTFLNLTHHPSSAWGEEQLHAARAFGREVTIVDQPFPRVDPAATTEQIDRLADDLTNDIVSRYPGDTVVHLMGELTLVVAMVARLQGLGYTVVASTTERISTEAGDGSRTLKFVFQAFRAYAPLYSASE